VSESLPRASEATREAERGATNVTIIGLGAIGGSAALKLIERGVVPSGFTTDEEDRSQALAAGVRVAQSAGDAVRDADLVLIAVPLEQLADVARTVMRSCSPQATILHASSLQRPDATRLDPETAARVIGAHPLAGSEQVGFGAAKPDLFRGARVYVESRGAADKQVREDAELFWSLAGASRIEYLEAGAHDDLMAAASHVPQILATALAATLNYANVSRAELGPGGRDMTRLAASSWSMWRPLFAATPGRTLAMLESIETELRDVRESIASGTLDETGVTWAVARGWALEESPGVITSGARDLIADEKQIPHFARDGKRADR
jgi:prephenate dehydrogenase